MDGRRGVFDWDQLGWTEAAKEAKQESAVSCNRGQVPIFIKELKVFTYIHLNFQRKEFPLFGIVFFCGSIILFFQIYFKLKFNLRM